MKNKPYRCFLVFLLVMIVASCMPMESKNTLLLPEIEETPTTVIDAAYWPTDSWRESTPIEQGMDAITLQKMLEEIDKEGLNIDSLIVVRNGYIVTEKYYPPYEQDTLHEAYSVTKSILSALVGIAIKNGYINSVNDPVLEYFPKRSFNNEDALKRSVTIKHLLTMTAGLEFDWDEMIWSQDWVQYVLDQPMYAKPGTEFLYSSGNGHVLSAIIQNTSGQNAHSFAQQYLFNDLGIENVRWQKDIFGISKGGWGMSMTPRDMAKIGYLYLNQGIWAGKQVVSAEWIEDSTKRYVQVPDPLEPWDLYLGYLWWLHEDGLFAAHGMKGQFIYVIPDFDLVVVITSNIPDAEFSQPQLLIRDFILPAVKSAAE